MDEQLQYALVKGDIKAFNTLFDQCFTRLCAIAYQYINDKQTCESIVIDVMYILWQKKENILPVTSLNAYLKKAVQNKCIDYLRKPHPEFTEISNYLFIDQHDLIDTYIAQELELKIEEIIGRLPERTRQVFTMSRMQGKSNEEIAQELGLSINTVKYHIKGALSTLRQELTPYLLTLLFLILHK